MDDRIAFSTVYVFGHHEMIVWMLILTFLFIFHLFSQFYIRPLQCESPFHLGILSQGNQTVGMGFAAAKVKARARVATFEKCSVEVRNEGLKRTH